MFSCGCLLRALIIISCIKEHILSVLSQYFNIHFIFSQEKHRRNLCLRVTKSLEISGKFEQQFFHRKNKVNKKYKTAQLRYVPLCGRHQNRVWNSHIWNFFSTFSVSSLRCENNISLTIIKKCVSTVNNSNFSFSWELFKNKLHFIHVYWWQVLSYTDSYDIFCEIVRGTKIRLTLSYWMAKVTK